MEINKQIKNILIDYSKTTYRWPYQYEGYLIDIYNGTKLDYTDDIDEILIKYKISFETLVEIYKSINWIKLDKRNKQFK